MLSRICMVSPLGASIALQWQLVSSHHDLPVFPFPTIPWLRIKQLEFIHFKEGGIFASWQIFVFLNLESVLAISICSVPECLATLPLTDQEHDPIFIHQWAFSISKVSNILSTIQRCQMPPNVDPAALCHHQRYVVNLRHCCVGYCVNQSNTSVD